MHFFKVREENEDKGIPMGSPLSPLLGAIALIPLDKAMDQVRQIFYARYMDDWVVFTKSKTALRKIVKITNGFNFLGYYMDDLKILPSKETIRRFHERGSAFYEQVQGNRNISHRGKRNPHGRDVSEYKVNEPAPTEEDVQNIFSHLMALTANKPSILETMRKYVRKWACWLRLGLSTLKKFEESVQTLLPSIYSCWMPETRGFLTTGSCL